MARSVHTRPRAIRAVARLHAPYELRGAHDASGVYAAVRRLKAQGLAPISTLPSDYAAEPLPLPRIRIQRPQAGMFHPLSQAEIRATLNHFGAECVYGLRSIELRDAPPIRANDNHPFGRLIVPGRVILWAQPLPPWTLPGRLPAATAERFARAGAVVTVIAGGAQTIVAWPGETLREFMRFDVLHEIGHHIIQHEKGKRTARVLRTKDHEAWADAFVRHCCAEWRADEVAD